MGLGPDNARRSNSFRPEIVHRREPIAFRVLFRIVTPLRKVGCPAFPETFPCTHRRNQRVRPSYAKPELVASAPNQVWSWDITRLLGPRAWTYYYLYVLLDIFSRYAVGWMVADRETPRSPGDSSRRPASGTVSSPKPSRCTRTAARR